MAMALSVRGPYRGYSGHDNTVRSFVRALDAAGVAIGLEDVPEWSPAKLADQQLDPWFKLMERRVASPVSLQFCMPHQVAPRRNRAIVNFTMFEATPAPADWVETGSKFAMTVLPTHTAFNAWVEAGAVPENLRLCPLGVDCTRFKPGFAPLPLKDRKGRHVSEYRVRILNVSDIVPRKNLTALLRTWISTTSSDDDAILLLKLTHGRTSAVQLMRDLDRTEKQIGKSRTDSASILIFDDVLSDEDMPRLYATATHYWSMSCGEGWDQPMTEAGASGLHLIAPDHTAYRTYLNPDIATLVPARRERVPPLDNPAINPFFAGKEWWRPDETAASEAISRAITRTDPVRSARQHLASEFSWARAAERLITILEDLPERSLRRGWASRMRSMVRR